MKGWNKCKEDYLLYYKFVRYIIRVGNKPVRKNRKLLLGIIIYDNCTGRAASINERIIFDKVFILSLNPFDVTTWYKDEVAYSGNFFHKNKNEKIL